MSKTNSLRCLILILTSSLLIIGCRPVQDDAIPFTEVYAPDSIAQVQIFVDRGEVEIKPAENDQTRLVISNYTAGSSVMLIGDLLLIDLPDSRPEDRIVLSLSGKSDLKVNAFDGLVRIIEAAGEVDVRSTAGDISVKGLQGSRAVLWAGRGNIFVAGGSGEVVLIGEHGRVDVLEFSGPLSVSTIMGSIHYTGTPGSSSEVSLETDHGQIRAFLPDSSHYQIKISSTSGEVSCIGDELTETYNGCWGVTGTGRGGFNIRTVSGRIVFRLGATNR